MTKSEADMIVNKFRELGIERWVYHCANGDIREHNSENAFSVHKDDYVNMIELSRNYSDEKGGEFTMRFIPYDKIDEIDCLDVKYEAGVQMVKDLDLETEEVKEFLKTMPRRTMINTDAKAGYEGDFGKDEDGKPIIPKGMSGFVVR